MLALNLSKDKSDVKMLKKKLAFLKE